jgi:hypothetical protein
VVGEEGDGLSDRWVELKLRKRNVGNYVGGISSSACFGCIGPGLEVHAF